MLKNGQLIHKQLFLSFRIIVFKDMFRSKSRIICAALRGDDACYFNVVVRDGSARLTIKRPSQYLNNGDRVSYGSKINMFPRV